MKNLFLGLVVCVLSVLTGCGTVGSKTELNKDNEVSSGTSAPHNLSLRDGQKAGQTNGVGPSVFQNVNVNGAETLTSGTPINSVVFTNDFQSGVTTVALSGGTNFTAKGVVVDPSNGQFAVAEVGSDASKPIQALEPAVIEQIRATKDALIEQIKAAKEISDTAKSLLISVVEKLATGGL